jgi:TonB family protein
MTSAVIPLKKVTLALLALAVLVTASAAQDAAIKVAVISAPRPDYPLEARIHRAHGTGLYVMNIDPNTGLVTSVSVERTSGNWILDAVATNTFSRWRFLPHTLSKARMPVTWALP